MKFCILPIDIVIDRVPPIIFITSVLSHPHKDVDDAYTDDIQSVSGALIYGFVTLLGWFGEFVTRPWTASEYNEQRISPAGLPKNRKFKCKDNKTPGT